MSALLQLEKTTIRFGGLTAVSELDLQIGRGELVGLIGPNGAGKTTAFNLITGVYQPTSGAINFDGQSTVGRKPYQITQRGIARTFQNIRLFPSLNVFDNVRAVFICICMATCATRSGAVKVIMPRKNPWLTACWNSWKFSSSANFATNRRKV